MAATGTTGWYSRGYLPHLNVPGLVQSITTHLGDSLPKATLHRLLAETERDDIARRQRLDTLLDAGHGACWLSRAEIAELVEQTLLEGDGECYRLLSWVIMPNHLHVLIETLPPMGLGEVVRRWKGSTSRAANGRLGRSGAFWERDYFDRYIRDDAHLAAVTRYIEQNPVKAGLVARAEDWRYGSAWRREAG
ncbi:REP-associated tyrosine transposase [Thiorhodococcus mannitoliphagus]|nr:transposase [Thiorhodococcus mannitoliphagus]